MRPFLFNIFINHLEKVMEHTVINTAYSTRLAAGESVKMFSGRAAIQKDLGRLEEGENRDRVKLNKDEYQVLALGWGSL